jgi:hypothetical protein
MTLHLIDIAHLRTFNEVVVEDFIVRVKRMVNGERAEALESVPQRNWFDAVAVWPLNAAEFE